MVKARRTFLDRGFFAPLSERLNRCVLEFIANGRKHTHDSEEIRILDAGCGEGYYLSGLCEHLGQSTPEIALSCFGVDVSKDAIRLATKRQGPIRWVVANLSRQAPFGDRALDAILNIFAPRNVAEFARVLSPGGLLVTVIPGTCHLTELREKVMDFAQDYEHKEFEVVNRVSASFRVSGQDHLKYTMILDREALLNLICMTPIYWRSTREAKIRAEAIECCRVTAEFTLLFLTPAL